MDIVSGNLLKDFNGDIIVHQVNCQGVMSAGIAKQIKIKYPKSYREYVNYCKSKIPISLMGDCIIL